MNGFEKLLADLSAVRVEFILVGGLAVATIRHLDAEGLIRLKKDSLRPKDQLDVQVLRDLRPHRDD